MDVENFKEYLQSTNLSESSVRNYTSKIDILVNKQTPIKGSEQDIIDSLAKLYPKILTRKGMLFPVIKFRDYYELGIDNLQKEYKRLQNSYNESQKEQVSKKELPSLKYLLKCKQSPRNSAQDKLLYRLYTKYAAVRNDFIDVKFYTDEGNHYNKKTREIILLNHKTSHIHGPIKIKLLKPEMTLINRLMKERDSYMFLSKNSKPFSTSGFTTYLKNLFNNVCGYPLSSSDLRKIHVIASQGQSIKEKEKLAEQMGHSVGTAELHYNKVK